VLTISRLQFTCNPPGEMTKDMHQGSTRRIHAKDTPSTRQGISKSQPQTSRFHGRGFITPFIVHVEKNSRLSNFFLPHLYSLFALGPMKAPVLNSSKVPVRLARWRVILHSTNPTAAYLCVEDKTIVLQFLHLSKWYTQYSDWL
jgi:hypothetical protein